MNARARAILSAVFALLAALSSETLLAGVGERTNSGPDGASVVARAADPSNTSTIYATTTRRVYKSVDAGGPWAPTGLSGYFNQILTTSEPSIVYAVKIGSPYERLSRTANAGDDWVERSAPADRPPLESIASDTIGSADQVTGAVKTYRRGAPGGAELCGEADTSAFRN